MRLGSPIAAGLGSAELHVEYVKIELVRGIWRARWKPRTGYGDAWFGVYNNAVKQTHVKAAEGEEQLTEIIPNPGKDISVLVLRLGVNASFPGADYGVVARTFESEDAKRSTILFDWVGDVFGTFDDDETYTTNWSLSGIKYSNTIPESGHSLWTYLDFDMTVSAGTATLTLSNGGVTVAEGSGAVGTTITLDEVDDSGISGQADVDPSAVTVSGSKVYVRWPKQMQILRDASDPPTTVIDLVDFDKKDRYIFTEEADVNAGTYYYATRSISETGDVGDQTTAKSVLIKGVPEPPTDIAYSSGNAGSVTLTFTPSATPGATYRAYVANVGEVIDPFNPVATAIAGANSITFAVSGYPGVAAALVHAVNGTDEERNADVVLMEFDSGGVYIPPRPNTPTFVLESLLITGGRDLSVTGAYATLDEKGVATELQLFERDVGDPYDFNTPVATGSLVEARDGIKTAALAYTFPSNAKKFICLKAATADGTLSDQSEEIRIYPTDANQPAASGFDVIPARG